MFEMYSLYLFKTKCKRPELDSQHPYGNMQLSSRHTQYTYIHTKLFKVSILRGSCSLEKGLSLHMYDLLGQQSCKQCLNMQQETPPISSSKQALLFEVGRGLRTRVRLVDGHWPVPIGHVVQILGRRKSYASIPNLMY